MGEVTMNLVPAKASGMGPSLLSHNLGNSGHMRNGHGNRMEGEKKITGSF